MKVDISVEYDAKPTARMRQMSAMFDAPIAKKMERRWEADVPIEERDWQIGAIIGPSGSGKSTIARAMFGEPTVPTWTPRTSIVDSFGDASIERIAEVLSSVGFNTIPAWMRPHETLSNGEKFRCDLARVLMSETPRVWVDEFTSVVDRQVACIGSHAIARQVRRSPGRQLVVASCHHDIVDWLQPDWTLEPATMAFTWRELRRRPSIEAVVKRVPRSVWQVFAPFHYMSAELHPAAKCFAVHVDDRPVAFIAALHQPVSSGKDAGQTIIRISRAVVLPDWQGIGVHFQHVDIIASAYKAIGKRLRVYPAHHALIAAHRRRSDRWIEVSGSTEMGTRDLLGGQGRACGRFEYIGEPMDLKTARRLLATG